MKGGCLESNKGKKPATVLEWRRQQDYDDLKSEPEDRSR